MKKRILAMIMTLSMLCTLVPMTALATETSETITGLNLAYANESLTLSWTEPEAYVEYQNYYYRVDMTMTGNASIAGRGQDVWYGDTSLEVLDWLTWEEGGGTYSDVQVFLYDDDDDDETILAQSEIMGISLNMTHETDTTTAITLTPYDDGSVDPIYLVTTDLEWNHATMIVDEFYALDCYEDGGKYYVADDSYNLFIETALTEDQPLNMDVITSVSAGNDENEYDITITRYDVEVVEASFDLDAPTNLKVEIDTDIHNTLPILTWENPNTGGSYQYPIRMERNYDDNGNPIEDWVTGYSSGFGEYMTLEGDYIRNMNVEYTYSQYGVMVKDWETEEISDYTYLDVNYTSYPSLSSTEKTAYFTYDADEDAYYFTIEGLPANTTTNLAFGEITDDYGGNYYEYSEVGVGFCETDDYGTVVFEIENNEWWDLSQLEAMASAEAMGESDFYDITLYTEQSVSQDGDGTYNVSLTETVYPLTIDFSEFESSDDGDTTSSLSIYEQNGMLYGRWDDSETDAGVFWTLSDNFNEYFSIYSTGNNGEGDILYYAPDVLSTYNGEFTATKFSVFIDEENAYDNWENEPGDSVEWQTLDVSITVKDGGTATDKGTITFDGTREETHSDVTATIATVTVTGLPENTTVFLENDDTNGGKFAITNGKGEASFEFYSYDGGANYSYNFDSTALDSYDAVVLTTTGSGVTYTSTFTTYALDVDGDTTDQIDPPANLTVTIDSDIYQTLPILTWDAVGVMGYVSYGIRYMNGENYGSTSWGTVNNYHAICSGDVLTASSSYSQKSYTQYFVNIDDYDGASSSESSVKVDYTTNNLYSDTLYNVGYSYVDYSEQTIHTLTFADLPANSSIQLSYGTLDGDGEFVRIYEQSAETDASGAAEIKVYQWPSEDADAFYLLGLGDKTISADEYYTLKIYTDASVTYDEANEEYDISLTETNYLLNVNTEGDIGTDLDPQTISWNYSGTLNLEYGTTSNYYTATNTSENGGAISYSSSDTDVVTVDSSTGAITIVGAGTATITATAAATDTYSATTSSYTVVVGQANPSASDFTATIPTGLTYGGTITATTIAVNEGLVGMGEVTAIYYDGSTTLPTDAGTYTVTFDVAEGTNYSDITGLTAGELVIAAYTDVSNETVTSITLPLSNIVFPDIVITGVDGEAVTGAVTYFVDGVNKDLDDDIMPALEALSGGESLSISYYFTSTDTNYSVTLLSGSITITMVDIAFVTDGDYITVSDAPTYGDSWDDILTVNVITATVGEETIDGTYSLNVTGSPDAGDYDYTLSFTSDDYADIYVTAGSVTVEPKALTIAVSDDSVYKNYDLPTSITLTYDGLVTGDSFDATPTFTLTDSEGATLADSSTNGSYIITWTNPEAFSDSNYTITIDPTATLTISTKPSSGGGGGSSDSTDSSDTSSDSTVSTNDNGDAVASVGADTSTSNGTTTATVSEETLTQAITDAVDATDDGVATVEIVATVSSSANAVAVEVPANALATLAESDVETLTITSEVGTLEISSEAAASIAAQAGEDAQVSITIGQVDTASELSETQQAVVGDSPVFDLSVTVDGDYVTHFDGGLITVSVPYELADGETGDGVVVWYLDDAGNLDIMFASYDDDTGLVTFTTTHFSYYVVAHNSLYATEQNFTDVDINAYYYLPMLWALGNGVTAGYEDDTFRPTASCTRAQAVTFLWRAAGEPEATIDNPFSDVAEGVYYYDAVLWAVENGITNGYEDGTFRPDTTCNRGAIVTFLYRFAGEPIVSGEAEEIASDVVDGTYYYNAVLWAIENGITTGYEDETFRPNTTCNRGAIVTFLYRYLAE
ncbi:S-layer homology domain-containing protein [Bengtsoniella intestinalis]|uniref:S-layer homology domain-containing protein n=1 Tax=Bengtsoniella intestinalis TaxID=3073143 RepID=UPI00391F4F14